MTSGQVDLAKLNLAQPEPDMEFVTNGTCLRISGLGWIFQELTWKWPFLWKLPYSGWFFLKVWVVMLTTCKLADTNLEGSALTLAKFLNSSSIGVTLSPGSVWAWCLVNNQTVGDHDSYDDENQGQHDEQWQTCIRFCMCWCKLRAGTSVFPERTAWENIALNI